MADEKQEELDPGFRIVDKRKGGASEAEEEQVQASTDDQGEGAAASQEPAQKPSEPGATAPAESAEAAGAPEGEAGQAPEPEPEPVDVYGVVQYCMAILNGHAWRWMGLVMDPVTHKIERDLAQARVAIDCMEALFKQVEAGMPGDQARQFRQTLNDLRVNFVRQSQGAS